MAITTPEGSVSLAGLHTGLASEEFQPLLHDISPVLFRAEGGRTRAARYGGVLSELIDNFGEGDILRRLWSDTNTTPEQRCRWGALLDGEGISTAFSCGELLLTEYFRTVSVSRQSEYDRVKRVQVSITTSRSSNGGNGLVGYLIDDIIEYPGNDVSALAHTVDNVMFENAIRRYGGAQRSHWPFGRDRRLLHATGDALQASYGISSRNVNGANNAADVVLTIAGIVCNGADKAGIDLQGLNPEAPRDAAILRLLACGDAIATSREIVLDPRNKKVE